MALTATLALDIGKFQAGLSTATASLEGFADKTVKNTNRDLSRLLESFTGQKVVAEAERMAEAVGRIGGASKLTETEQRRVNAAVSEAIAKYQALGQEAPAHLVKLQQETAGAVEKTSLLSQGMQVLIGLFSARAILNAARDVLEFTGNLADLAAKTGISAVELQKLQYVTAQSGVSMDELARGAVKLGQNLVSGNKSAVEGVKALGFEVSALTAMNPGDAFLQIGQAIAAVPNPMERAALAVGIFGKAGADFLPAFTTDMKALADQAQASGAILSEDMVQAGDSAGDAITRLQTAGLSLMAQFLVPVLPAVEALANMLSANLPSALSASRSAFDGLLRKGLEFEVWLAETAQSITETAASVPVLGRVFGQTSGDVEFFRQRAQHAKDALKLFDLDGVKPATASIQAAIPTTTGFSEALERTRGASAAARESLGAMQGPAAELANLEARSTAETGRLNQELERWARINGSVLAPSISQVNAALSVQAPLVSSMQMQWAQFPGTVAQSTATAQGGISGFFSKVFGGAEGLSSSLSSLFAQAFTGGGGALGAVKAFATQGLSTMLGMIPHVGPWAQAFAGPIVAMLSKLSSKFKEFFKGIFGGPSQDELAGRSRVAEFEDELHGALNATQRLEAGNEKWKMTVIALRDKYIEMGRTEEEALADAKRLWESSKISAEESAKVIEEIRRKLEGLPTEKTIDIDVNYNEGERPPGLDGRASPTVEARTSAAMGARVTPGAAGERAAAAGLPATGGDLHVHVTNGVFDGYASEQAFARRVMDVLSQEQERRLRVPAVAGA